MLNLRAFYIFATDERRNRCSSPFQSRETFCDSVILLHECENGVRKIWLTYLFEKAHLVKIKTMTHKLTVVIYRNILMELCWTGGKKRHKTLKVKEEQHCALCKLLTVLGHAGLHAYTERITHLLKKKQAGIKSRPWETKY